MLTWKEYSEDIRSYYNWLSDIPYFEHNKFSVFSYNAESIYNDKEIFWKFCQREIVKNIPRYQLIHVYILVIEKVLNTNSKVEQYKKCWGKLNSMFRLDNFYLNKELKFIKNNNIFYTGIAKTNILNLNDALEIIDKKANYLMFLGNNNFVKENNYKSFLACMMNVYNNESIEYSIFFELCNQFNIIPCRYGKDSLGVELAFILNSLNKNIFNLNE